MSAVIFPRGDGGRHARHIACPHVFWANGAQRVWLTTGAQTTVAHFYERKRPNLDRHR
jgi:hypothetical protein